MNLLRKVLFIIFMLLPASGWAVPAAVSDLSAPTAGFRHVTLTWSTPYDGVASTVAAYYNIRCSTSTPIITDADWNNCPASPLYPYNISFSTHGCLAGDHVAFSITGLSDGRDYFFAIKSSTDNNFWSALDTSTPRAFNTPFNSKPMNIKY